MKSEPRIPVNSLCRLDSAEKSELLDRFSNVLDSGNYLNGRCGYLLEQSFSEFLDMPCVVGVSNGSDALYVALSAIGVKDGDTVATVGNAAGYATNAVLRCEAVPVLIEVNPVNAQISVDEVRRYLMKSPRVTAVVVTHLYGLTADLKSIADVCDKFGILLVEDCAQSFGAQLDGRRAGSWGDAAAFSFYPTKNLAALGDGGMVAFKDSEACARAKKIAQYGWSSRYEVEIPNGINSRLDEIQAAVVLHRLGSVDSRNSRRRDILRRYAEAVTMPRRFIFEDSERCVAHLAVMRTPTRDRDRTILNDHGIDTAIHYPIPDHHQPAWRHLFEGVSLPNTEAHCQEVLTLPCFPDLTEEEIVRVCEALQSL